MKALHCIFIVLESTALFSLVGWLVFSQVIPSTAGFIQDETELRFQFAEGQEDLLRHLDSFTVFYATRDNPKQWTDPKLRFSRKIDDAVIGKWYTHKMIPGVKQFRLEFNPKAGCEVGRCWPVISTIYLGNRAVRPDETREYYYEPGQKPSYDVILADYTKGGALWIVIAVAAVLDLLTLVMLFLIIKRDAAV